MDVTIINFNDRGEELERKTFEVEKLSEEVILNSTMSLYQGQEIQFVTGENNKLIELQANLAETNVALSCNKLDLDEIQADDPIKIVTAKCLKAHQHLNKSPADNIPVLVEDTCVHFNALNGMPGPYIKWFLKALGTYGLYKILGSYEDKTSEAVCLYALMLEPSEVIIFRGTCYGKMVEPRGESWGWDPIFEEKSTHLTYAEMDLSMKNKLSHRAAAVRVMKTVFGKTLVSEVNKFDT